MKRTRRFGLWTVAFFAVILLGIQLIRPEIEHRTVAAEERMNAHVDVYPRIQRILDRACADCHSDEADLPWFTSIAPASWFVARTVHDGRSKMNLTRWNSYTWAEQDHLLARIGDMVKYDQMPPRLYLLVRRNARLSTDDRFAMYLWAQSQRRRLQLAATEEHHAQ